MDEDTEYKKLPVDERCVHKLWKARLDGYDELIKIFRGIDDEKSPEWNKYAALIKKFIVDSHAMAQERGLEVTLIFVENAACAGKTVGEVVSGMINKCFSAPKAKIKDLATQITLMYIEIEKADATVEELTKGLDHKNPKIIATSIAVLTQALREFGNKVIGIKPFIKKIPVLLADRDKNVRDETKLLTIEINRWIGPALKPHLATVAQVLQTELESEFEKRKGEKAEPTRYLKSQQERLSAAAVSGDAGGDDENGNDDEDNQQADEIDPSDLIDPVDILSKLPKDFYDKLEAKKWQERKESLEALQTLLQNPKIESGDYGDMVKALKKVLTKDSNVVLVAMAGKCLACLAKGLGKKFSPYALACVSGVLEKFKEKKANVVTALREAIDAIYPSTTLDAMQEDLLEALNNKNPSIKAETASFLARAFSRTQPAILTKKHVKTFSTALIKTLNESDPTVRDSSAEALGTLLKLVGDKMVGPFLAEVDPLKMVKIKECSEKAVITVKSAAPKKERPTTAPVKAAPIASRGGSTEPKAVARPATAIKKTIAPARKVNGATSNAVGKSTGAAKGPPTERDLTVEELDEKVQELLPSDVVAGICDANWKTRLSSAEAFLAAIDGIESKQGNSQTLLRTLCKKPGLKDTNFQVLKVKLDAIAVIVEKLGVTATTIEYILNDIVVLLADGKNGAGARHALTVIAEAIRLEYVVSKIVSFAFEQKSPKVQADTLNWVASAIKEFGMQVNPKVLLDDVKKAVQSTNPTVRQAAIQLLGVMYMYMGNTLAMFFDSEKPALKQQIQAEFDKYADQAAPKATRGLDKSGSKSSFGDNEDIVPDEPQQQMKLTDMLPRTDVAPQITETLLAEISDKNWKTRNEGLTKLQGILNEAKLIKPTIGDLPQSLAHRLVDSNAKIAQTTMEICKQLAESMGAGCKQHVRVLFPGFLNGLGDNKSFVRTASMDCINTWGDQCGYKEFFDGEMIAAALKSGSPTLRIELWAWLTEQLPKLPPKSISKDEIIACLPYLYANICDRNQDVRKNANEAVLGCMLHVGYEAMFKAMETQKPANKKTIQEALDKARPNLPVKPLPKNKQQAPIEQPKAVKAVAGKGGKIAVANAKAPVSRKKEEEIDTSPLLSVNNLKNQRMLDEQKMKVIRWTFTTPREEFTELLRDQMTAANVNKNLMANMFHEDFRYHLRVIESLQDDLASNTKALICNLDLILKWLSIRFYDTNPSVLLKGLDYLNFVLQTLIASEYECTECEANSFLPHLLVKLGDQKDTVRNGVRSIFRQICLTYPYTKVFQCIMEGLKSKNARQRTECLDELGYLIESYGMGACQPTPQGALKEIARNISDRDNSVRSAALNCVVQAYFLIDERVYKLIGQLSEKDLSMLDERIKRAKKTRKVPAEVPMKVVAATMPKENVVIEDDEEDTYEEEIEPEPVEQTIVVQPAQDVPRTPRSSGPFKLDQTYISEIEEDWVRSDNWEKGRESEVNLDFLHSPLKVGEVNGVSYPADRLQRLISNSATHIPVGGPTLITSPPLNATISSPTTPQNLPDILPKLDPNLMRILRSVGSSDLITARAGLIELNDILESQEKQAAIRDYEEIYIENVCLQFRNLSQTAMSEALPIYQPLLSSIYSFYTSRSLGKNVGVEPLKKLMALIIGLMADQKLPNSDDSQYTKVVNGICLKILDKSHFNNINCALIRLLKETCSGAGLPKFTDLLMKCIWRNVKNMPDRSNELDYDAVLMEVHEFMAALPSTWWQQRHADTPYRTVKTIIHNLAQIKGNGILQHLKKIPTHSELYSYLIKVLKNLHKDGSNATNSASGAQKSMTPSGAKSSKSLSMQSHEAISAIFKLISEKETGREGIQKLYEFKSKNPDVDIEHFLRDANPIFRKFIDDGLAELENESMAGPRESDNNSNKVLAENRYGTHKVVSREDPDYWMERLNRIKGGTNSQTDDQYGDNRSSVENLNINQLTQKNNTLMQKEINEPVTNNRNELLKRLAQIRSQK